MKKTLALLLMLFLCSSLASCSAAPGEGQVWAYDTLCTGKFWGGTDPERVFSEAARQGEHLLSPEGDKQFTASREGAELPVSSDFFRILNQAGILYTLTGGVFDLTVAPLSDLWDVNAATEPPAESEIAEALALVGWEKTALTADSLTFSKAGMGIDIGSVGKGYGADLTVNALKNAGCTAGVVSFGGNVALFGTRDGAPFRVGVRDPESEMGEYLGILTLTDTSVVTSGAYERYFEYDETVYHHLLDAKTGYPRESDLLSVTVICEDGAQADLLSTALWLMGEAKGWELYETVCRREEFAPCQVIFVTKDRSVRISEGLSGCFQLTAEGYTLG